MTPRAPRSSHPLLFTCSFSSCARLNRQTLASGIHAVHFFARKNGMLLLLPQLVFSARSANGRPAPAAPNVIVPPAVSASRLSHAVSLPRVLRRRPSIAASHASCRTQWRCPPPTRGSSHLRRSGVVHFPCLVASSRLAAPSSAAPPTSFLKVVEASWRLLKTTTRTTATSTTR